MVNGDCSFEMPFRIHFLFPFLLALAPSVQSPGWAVSQAASILLSISLPIQSILEIAAGLLPFTPSIPISPLLETFTGLSTGSRVECKFLSLAFWVLHLWLQQILLTLSIINSSFDQTGLLRVSQTVLALFTFLPRLKYIPSLLTLFKFYPFPNTQLRFHLLLEAQPDIS